jgi:hypothetical protein
MPLTAIIFFIGLLPILLFSGYQSFRYHPASAGWFETLVNQPLIVVHYNMVSTFSPVLTFKGIA